MSERRKHFVVTTLLPDDPRPGDDMLHLGRLVEVVGPPLSYTSAGLRFVPVVHFATGDAYVVAIGELRRPPKLTYRLDYVALNMEQPRLGYLDFDATSIDDALAKLRDALTEVES